MIALEPFLGQVKSNSPLFLRRVELFHYLRGRTFGDALLQEFSLDSLS